MSKTAFIINPNSGKKGKKNRLSLLKKAMPPGLDYEFFFWEKLEQKDELFARVLAGDYPVVAAVGGDGTVNAVASALTGTSRSLAIIPFGSGNGLARHLKIPMDTGKALELLLSPAPSAIDTCYLNDKAFFCTAGAGFDAHIVQLFAKSTKRGFASYAGLSLKQFREYKPQYYKLTVDGVESEHEAFLITFANAAQYGNNAYIAPKADISDGLIDISIVRPFPLLKGLPLAYRMFNKSLGKSRDVKMMRGKHIVLERQSEGPVHYDGEPAFMGRKLELKIAPLSLNVITTPASA